MRWSRLLVLSVDSAVYSRASNMRILVVLTLLLVAVPVHAEKNAFKWSEAHRGAARFLSDASVAGNMVGETVHSFRAPNRRHAFLEQGCQTGLSLLMTETLKLFIHRTRPDGSDRKSFPSGHSSMAMANSEWNRGIGLSVSFGTAIFRMGENKHYLTDTLGGLSVGFVADRVCDW
jgi:membrane-associated phospholipid phosphatase